MRTGLLGASAAVAMGAVAVASGLLPGGDRFEVSGGDRADRVRAGSLPAAQPQVSYSAPAPASTGTPGRDGGDPGDTASRGGERTASPAAPTSSASPSAAPSAARPSASPTRGPGDRPSAHPTGRPAGTPSPHRPASPTARPSSSGSPESAAEAEVVSLVNQERARAGCSPVAADGELAGLAQRFSDDMARRGFFGHTDPDGRTPWDRADDAGIADLGGENIARGQADARSVMETWMTSPGHRANILNCEYQTLGVGAHLGPGGPWWTQEFGF